MTTPTPAPAPAAELDLEALEASIAPGPWVVAFDEHPRNAQTYWVDDNAGHQLMTIRRLSEVDPEMHAAHARAIAALPALLAALRASRALLIEALPYIKTVSRNDMGGYSETTPDLYERMKAALATAKPVDTE